MSKEIFDEISKKCKMCMYQMILVFDSNSIKSRWPDKMYHCPNCGALIFYFYEDREHPIWVIPELAKIMVKDSDRYINQISEEDKEKAIKYWNGLKTSHSPKKLLKCKGKFIPQKEKIMLVTNKIDGKIEEMVDYAICNICHKSVPLKFIYATYFYSLRSANL